MSYEQNGQFVDRILPLPKGDNGRETGALEYAGHCCPDRWDIKLSARSISGAEKRPAAIRPIELQSALIRPIRLCAAWLWNSQPAGLHWVPISAGIRSPDLAERRRFRSSRRRDRRDGIGRWCRCCREWCPRRSNGPPHASALRHGPAGVWRLPSEVRHRKPPEPGGKRTLRSIGPAVIAQRKAKFAPPPGLSSAHNWPLCASMRTRQIDRPARKPP